MEVVTCGTKHPFKALSLRSLSVKLSQSCEEKFKEVCLSGEVNYSYLSRGKKNKELFSLIFGRFTKGNDNSLYSF